MKLRYSLFVLILFMLIPSACLLVKDREINTSDFLIAQKNIKTYISGEAALASGVGKTPENALVDLGFDENGRFLTPDDVNSHAYEHKKTKILLTSLPEYRKFLNLLSGSDHSERIKVAYGKYAKVFPINKKEYRFVFDAYQSKYLTREEVQKIIEEKSVGH